jgi:hypothetical protein
MINVKFIAHVKTPPAIIQLSSFSQRNAKKDLDARAWEV